MNKIVEIALRLPAAESNKWEIALSNEHVQAWCNKNCVKAAVLGLQRNVVLSDITPRGYHVCGETKEGSVVCFPADWV